MRYKLIYEFDCNNIHIKSTRFANATCVGLIILCGLLSMSNVWPVPETLQIFHTCVGRFELQHGFGRSGQSGPGGFFCGVGNSVMSHLSSWTCVLSQSLYLIFGTNVAEAYCYIKCFITVAKQQEVARPILSQSSFNTRRQVRVVESNVKLHVLISHLRSTFFRGIY